MDRVNLTEALGHTVGDLLRISSETFEARVAGTTPRRVLIDWPWLEVDQESDNHWDGTVGFPRDPDAYDWCNTPWRLEPDASELESGNSCFIGIPPTDVRITAIQKFDPPADFGFIPRPVFTLEMCPVDMLDDEDAGFVVHLDSGEPIDIEIIGGNGETGQNPVP